MTQRPGGGVLIPADGRPCPRTPEMRLTTSASFREVVRVRLAERWANIGAGELTRADMDQVIDATLNRLRNSADEDAEHGTPALAAPTFDDDNGTGSLHRGLGLTLISVAAAFALSLAVDQPTVLWAGVVTATVVALLCLLPRR
ncbi:MAG: hypothetical protein LC808_07865 [Actinobacteria bacterium]|nr:hypothetical protein [Actinomycetota bacterium]